MLPVAIDLFVAIHILNHPALTPHVSGEDRSLEGFVQSLY